MIGLWILAALLSALAALLVLRGAARSRGGEPEGAAELEVRRRQLAEIDELGARGLLGPGELKAARAEAGRRVLRTHDGTPATADAGAGRRVVLAAAVAAPLLALAAYVATGSPGLPDRPFARRLTAWKAEDPSRLGPAEMAALLTEGAKARPADATPLLYLAQAQALAGQDARVLITLREAVRRQPRRADAWILLGQAQVRAADGRLSPEARAAFTRAAALDPAAPEPAYFLARHRIQAGDVQGGLAAWKNLLARLPRDAAQRPALATEIAAVERTGALAAAAAQPPPQAAEMASDQRAFVQDMVDRLAARLKARPDDPAGWARLVRSYGVLGQGGRRAAAVAEARRRFGSRPQLVAAIVAGDEAQAAKLAR
jgi:cytochrome c-type biogenesis protein CcmH